MKYNKKLFFFISLLIIALSSCEQYKKPYYVPKEKKEVNLVKYKSDNIIGYKNKPIIVDYSFVKTLKKINYYAKKYGVLLYVTSSFRTPNQKLSKTVVKPATRSNHLAGHAIDMNIVYKGKWYDSTSMSRKNFSKLPYNVKLFLNSIRKDPDMRWGGDFTKEDPVHIDDNLNSNYSYWYARYKVCQEEYLRLQSKRK